MRFDGPTFARAWLAVAQAASQNADAFHLYRAVSIEEYDEGVRLISTDGHMMLTAWVPDLDHLDQGDPDDEGAQLYDAPEPPIDLLPAYTTTIRDGDHRAQSLLKYAIKLLSTFDKEIRGRVGLVKLDLHFEVERPEPDETDDVALDGMDYRYAGLEIPDAERVVLLKIDSAGLPFPDWRKSLTHRDPVAATDLRLNADLLSRVANVASYARGAVAWSLNGDRGAILLDYECPRPVVGGVLMPMRDLDAEEDEREACNACDDPDRLCLRHATGLATAVGRLGSSLRPGESLTISSPDDPDSTVTFHADDPPP